MSEKNGNSANLSPNNFAGRLKLVSEKFSSVSAFARESGVSEGAMRKWLRGISSPSTDNLVAIANAGDVSVEWLATGSLPQEATEDQIMDATKKLLPDPKKLFYASREEQIAKVEALEKQLEFDSPQSIFHFNWLYTHFSGNLSLIYMNDDSMEPTFQDGDMLLIKVADDNGSQTKEKFNGFYAFWFYGVITVKRIQVLPNGNLNLISDNKAYDNIVIDINNMPEGTMLIGKVVWYARFL
jgi:phage repressor protein C with HTH and peptisase S24 domain